MTAPAPTKAQPAQNQHCKLGALLWQDIEEEICEYRHKLKMTGDANRKGIVRAIKAYFEHKNGAENGPEPCYQCRRRIYG